MGYYINATPDGVPLKAKGKANDLVKAGANLLMEPPSTFEEIPEGKALVCVFHNGPFDAALVVYDEKELAVAVNPTDFRQKTFLLMDKAAAFELAGIKT